MTWWPLIGVRGGYFAVDVSMKGPRGLPEVEVVILLGFQRTSICYISFLYPLEMLISVVGLVLRLI